MGYLTRVTGTLERCRTHFTLHDTIGIGNIRRLEDLTHRRNGRITPRLLQRHEFLRLDHPAHHPIVTQGLYIDDVNIKPGNHIRKARHVVRRTSRRFRTIYRQKDCKAHISIQWSGQGRHTQQRLFAYKRLNLPGQSNYAHGNAIMK